MGQFHIDRKLRTKINWVDLDLEYLYFMTIRIIDNEEVREFDSVLYTMVHSVTERQTDGQTDRQAGRQVNSSKVDRRDMQKTSRTWSFKVEEWFAYTLPAKSLIRSKILVLHHTIKILKKLPY